MENAIVAVTNDKSATRAARFWVETNPPLGCKSSVLANAVFFKDGLVMMDGVTSIDGMRPSMLVTKQLSYRADWVRVGESKCVTCLVVDIMDGPGVGDVLYGKEFANLIVKRDDVGVVKGLTTMDGLKLPWFKTPEAARQEADEEQAKINKETRKQNGEMIEKIAELKRQTRAYAAWKAMPWAARTLVGLKRVMKRTPAMDEDRAWVVEQADKLGVEYAT